MNKIVEEFTMLMKQECKDFIEARGSRASSESEQKEIEILMSTIDALAQLNFSGVTDDAVLAQLSPLRRKFEDALCDYAAQRIRNNIADFDDSDSEVSEATSRCYTPSSLSSTEGYYYTGGDICMQTAISPVNKRSYPKRRGRPPKRNRTAMQSPKPTFPHYHGTRQLAPIYTEDNIMFLDYIPWDDLN